MIFGDCPYDCGEMIPAFEADRSGFVRTVCEACGQPYWTFISRLSPWSMRESDFLAEYAVDDESKTIKRHDGKPVNPYD